MRKISLEDKDFDSLTVYDTSGVYSDPKYKHDYDKGLPKLKRTGRSKEKMLLLKPLKTELKISKFKNSKVKTFPNVSKQIFKKKNDKEITQLYYARNQIITPEMEYCAIRENEGREKLLGKSLKKKI